LIWVAHASRVLVSASRRNRLFFISIPVAMERESKVRDREDALASTRDARATQIDECDLVEVRGRFALNPFDVGHF
jgi:hypothetical protein